MKKLMLEKLEDRCTPATLTFTPATGTLVYHGDAVGHQCYFFDDGKGDVIAFVGSGNSGTVQSFTGVKDFQSYDGSAPDVIDYVFTSPVNNNGSLGFGPGNQAETVTAVVTAGSTFHLEDTPGVVHGALFVDAIGANGTYSLSLGPVAAGAGVEMNGYDYGNFSITTNLSGNLAGYFEHDYVAYGNGGDFVMNYDGVLTGSVYLHVYSYTTGHTFDLELTAEAGSTGSVGGLVHTAGNDPSTFNVFDNGGLLNVDAYLEVAVGNPNVHHTSNVELTTY